MSKLKFTIHKTKWKARVWEIELNGVKVKTPVFMPVWTKATIKWLLLDRLKDKNFIGSDLPMNLILANTFHLYLHPGDQIIKEAWGLHKFENRDKLILTDSWGFQVFSLGLGKSNEESLVQLTKRWVWFRNPKWWSKHFFSPTWTVDVQCNFWSDIMMMLDVCSPMWITKEEVASHMSLTHQWAKQQFEHHQKKYNDVRWVLFPIIQWGSHFDLREESVKTLLPYATDWIAIWGMMWTDDMDKVTDFLTDFIPQEKPRYVMWIWSEDWIKIAVKNWVDMFDCVLPTRLGRHWIAMTSKGRIKMKAWKYKNDFSRLDENVPSYTSKFFTKAYLHHLCRENEMMGATLLSLHNISFLHWYVEQLRQEILQD